MVTPLRYRNVSGDQYNWALSAVYQDGMRVFDPSRALANDPDVFDKWLMCSCAGEALDQRTHAVAAKTWTVKPPSDEDIDVRANKLMEGLLRRIPRFCEARRILASACLSGSRYAAMSGRFVFDKIPGDDRARRWWQPGRLADMDRRRLRATAHKDEDGGVAVTWDLWSVGRRDWEDLEHPEWYVKHIWLATEDSLGYGKGLIESTWDDVEVLRIVEREGLQGLTRWAQGVLDVGIDGSKDAKTNAPNTTLATEWLAVLRKLMAKGGVVHDAGDVVKLLEGPGVGYQMVGEWLDRCERRIRRRVLGADLQSGSEGGGLNKGMGDLADARQMIIEGDQELLDDSLTVDLLGLLWKINKPTLNAAGLGEARMGRFITTKQPVADPKMEADIANVLLTAGVPLKKSEVYAKCGYTMPGPGDEVIEGKAAPSPFGGDPSNPFASAGAPPNDPNADTQDGALSDVEMDDGDGAPPPEQPAARRPNPFAGARR